MTREQIAELKRCVEADVTDPSNALSVAMWLQRNAAEFLSLAEEARWRSVTEEPPPVLEQVYIGTHVDALPIAYMDSVGVWSDANDEVIAVAPTHWRPLPRGPVKP